MNERITCFTCAGAGFMESHNSDQKWDCPACDGRGYSDEYAIIYLRDVGGADDPCFMPCAKGDAGAVRFIGTLVYSKAPKPLPEKAPSRG